MATHRQFEEFEIIFEDDKTYIVKPSGKQEQLIVGTDAESNLKCINLMRSKYGKDLETNSSELVIVEAMGCSPAADWALGRLTGGNDIYVNLKINTFEQFCTPFGRYSRGISGMSSPYPETSLVKKSPVNLFEQLMVRACQRWEIVLRFGDLNFSRDHHTGDARTHTSLKAFVIYTVYDGSDKVVADKLYETGVRISPDNIDWYKKELFCGRKEKEQETAEERFQAEFDTTVGKGGRLTIPEPVRKKHHISDGELVTVGLDVIEEEEETQKCDGCGESFKRSELEYTSAGDVDHGTNTCAYHCPGCWDKMGPEERANADGRTFFLRDDQICPKTINLSDDLMLPLKLAQDVTLVVGTKGSGKSTTVRKLMEELMRNGVRFICFDPLGVHKGIEGVEVKDCGSEHSDFTAYEVALNCYKSCIMDLSNISDEKKQKKIVGETCMALLSSNPANRGEVVVTIIEEAEEFAPSGNAKYIYDSIIPLNRLAKMGRARGCGLVMVTGSPNKLSAKLRAQASHFIVHRMTNYTEFDVLKRALDTASRGDTKGFIQKVFAFKPGEALVLSPYAPDGIAFTKIGSTVPATPAAETKKAIAPRETQMCGVDEMLMPWTKYCTVCHLPLMPPLFMCNCTKKVMQCGWGVPPEARTPAELEDDKNTPAADLLKRPWPDTPVHLEDAKVEFSEEDKELAEDVTYGLNPSSDKFQEVRDGNITLWTCHDCGTQYPDMYNVCLKCGVAKSYKCPKCGTVTEYDSEDHYPWLEEGSECNHRFGKRYADYCGKEVHIPRVTMPISEALEKVPTVTEAAIKGIVSMANEMATGPRCEGRGDFTGPFDWLDKGQVGNEDEDEKEEEEEAPEVHIPEKPEVVHVPEYIKDLADSFKRNREIAPAVSSSGEEPELPNGLVLEDPADLRKKEILERLAVIKWRTEVSLDDEGYWKSKNGKETENVTLKRGPGRTLYGSRFVGVVDVDKMDTKLRNNYENLVEVFADIVAIDPRSRHFRNIGYADLLTIMEQCCDIAGYKKGDETKERISPSFIDGHPELMSGDISSKLGLLFKKLDKIAQISRYKDGKS